MKRSLAQPATVRLVLVALALALVFAPRRGYSQTAFSVDGSVIYSTGGKVGINQTAISSNFEVKSTTGPSNYVLKVSSQNNAQMFSVQGSGEALLVGALSASSATLTASGSGIFTLTTSSGIHILGGGILWADGTTSTTAFRGSASGSTGAVGFATAAVNNDQTTTSASYSIGFATVSYTVQSTSSLLKFCFHGSSRNSAANDAWGINWIMDGGYVNPRAANVQPYMGFNTTADRDLNSSFCDLIPPGSVSVGAHKFVLVAKSRTGGTTTKICDSSLLPQDCSISLEEIIP